MEKVKSLIKNKVFLASAGGVVVLAVIIGSICLFSGKKQPDSPTAKLPDSSNTRSTLLALEDGALDSSAPEESSVSSGEKAPDLDVSGNPGSKPESTGKGNNTTSTKPAQTPTGSTITTTTKDPVQSKPAKPTPQPPAESQTASYPASAEDWTPPPPGVGTGALIGEGYENVPINTSEAIDELQQSLAALVDSKLLEKGYNTYFSSGYLIRFAEDSVTSYAKTGAVSLSPGKYSLPKVVCEYHIKLKASGKNMAEAADYVYNAMTGDKVFQEKYEKYFTQAKSGYLSIYQKDGYFYVLAVMVDRRG